MKNLILYIKSDEDKNIYSTLDELQIEYELIDRCDDELTTYSWVSMECTNEKDIYNLLDNNVLDYEVIDVLE